VHTYQILLTEADSKADAKQKVQRFLETWESVNTSWWDWRNHNGDALGLAGRWKDRICEGDALNYHRYPEKFDTIVAQSLENRYTYFNKYKELMEQDNFSIKDLDIRNPDYVTRLSLDRLREMIEIYNDKWTDDSAVFDTVSRSVTEEERDLFKELYGHMGWFVPSADISGFEVRRRIHPEKQWLVVVDFHF
jgi:hypothetical protein